MAEYESILYEVSDRVATLTLNDPESRNMMSPVMLRELEDACESAQRDPGISALILTGAGTAFCAGVSPARIKARMEQEDFAPVRVPASYRENIHRIPRCLESLDLPLIAAVNGAAVGAGLGLALLCDFRLASPWAKFGEVFIDLGAVPGDGSPWFLTRAVSFAHAAEMTFTGRMVEAAEALEMGLVLEVVEAEQLLPRARMLAETIAAKSPATVRMTKRLLKQATRLNFQDFLDVTGAYQGLVSSTEDYREGMLARAEKRAPVFKGR